MNQETDVSLNALERLFYPGSDITSVCKIISYEFVDPDKIGTKVINNCSAQHMWICPIHGRGCMGHFEISSHLITIMMPSTIIPSIDNVVNRYQRYKNLLCSNKITPPEYRQLTSKIMMGKNGIVRSMNQI
jgi:hypothetical protein